MRISYELEDRYAATLTQQAEACGLAVESLAHQIVVQFLHKGRITTAHEVRAEQVLDHWVPFNSLEGAEDLDWSDEPRQTIAMNRHLAEMFAVCE